MRTLSRTLRPLVAALAIAGVAGCASYVKRDEYDATIAELRANAPIHFNDEGEDGSGFYSIARYHDIVKVLRDPETFTSERFTNLEEVDAEQEEARRSLLETDGTRHRALRRRTCRGPRPSSCPAPRARPRPATPR